MLFCKECGQSYNMSDIDIDEYGQTKYTTKSGSPINSSGIGISQKRKKQATAL